MYRSHPNLSPVSNKYLEHKRFLKDQEIHRNNLKQMQGLLDLSAPPARAHCSERLRQKTMREYETKIIDRENDRLRQRMLSNGAFVDSHHDFSHHSLNSEKRQREESEHKHEINRLQKQIKQTRSNYPTRDYENDFHKQQDFKRRISRYPSEMIKK